MLDTNLKYQTVKERPLSIGGAFSHRILDTGAGPTDNEIEKLIYDGSYWYKKVDILMKDKKKHLEDSHKSRSELTTL